MRFRKLSSVGVPGLERVLATGTLFEQLLRWSLLVRGPGAAYDLEVARDEPAAEETPDGRRESV